VSDSKSVQDAPIVSHDRVVDAIRSELHTAIVVLRRFTVQQLSERSGVAKATIESYMRNDGAKEPSLARALSIASIIGQKSQVQWRTEITLEIAATGVERRLAAKNLISRLYRGPVQIAPLPAPRPAPAAPVVTLVEPAGGHAWCDQCDRRVTAAEVGRCTDRFCKARAAA
jgi:transcriptional regulator with XRE-family HTH domain